jgi:aminoglycoside phosphotransferase
MRERSEKGNDFLKQVPKTPNEERRCYFRMKHEIARVVELTGAAENRIVLHDGGYWSRTYVVDGGELVVKLPKYDTVDYGNEARFLSLVGSMALPVNTQKLKWLAEDNRCIVMYGVKGTPLSQTGNLGIAQKQSIGRQIGTFLKQLHSLKPDFPGQNLEGEFLEYNTIYDDCADFYAKHFSTEEIAALDTLMYDYLPTARRKLGENLVFSHADIWEPNILLDDNGVVGIIDCGNAGYYDDAADFMVEDKAIRDFILDNYGASEDLRKKVDVKYDMSTIAGPGFGVTLWGEAFVVEKWVPIIRGLVRKYERD